jgi:hypothetical protein
VHDVVIAHPPRTTPAGDAVNVTGPATAPMTGLAIDHVVFESCARYGVQVSRGVSGGRISDSSFGDGCAFGSESAVAVDGLVMSHDTFTSTTTGGLAINAQHLTNFLVTHAELRGRGLLLFHCDHCRVEHSLVTDLVPGVAGDYVGAVNVRDSAHDVSFSDVMVTQATNAAAPAISAGPLRPQRQADLSGIVVDGVTIIQLTPAPIVSVRGVAGFQLTNSVLTYAGPPTFVSTSLSAGPSVSTPPATSVDTTGVVTEGNVLAGVPQ